MATIRRKTAIPALDDFKYARKNGIDLSWDNYEQMLPQDGFARLGLACSDCLMGPCRINPFDRGSEKTVCGLGRKELAYRSMMHLMGAAARETADPMAAILETAAAKCPQPVKVSDGCTSVGAGVLKPDMINVLCEGVPFARLAELEKAAETADAAGAKGFNFVLVGACCSKRNTACGLANVELAMLTGLVDAYLLGAGAVGLGRNAAAAYHTAVLCPGMETGALLKKAAEAYAKRDAAKIRPAGEPVQLKMHSLESLAEIAGSCDKVALFAGDANIKRTVGAAVIDTIKALTAKGVACFTFGNAAVEAAGLDGAVYASGAAVSDVAACEAIMKKVCAVCMPELALGGTVAQALCMGGKGAPVLTCTELPVEGCPELADALHESVEYCAPGDFTARALECAGEGV